MRSRDAARLDVIVSPRLASAITIAAERDMTSLSDPGNIHGETSPVTEL
jgi:hypothetical protein